MLAQRVDGLELEDAIEMSERWQLECETVVRLQILARGLPWSLSIVSGYRTLEEQRELDNEGRPTAPDNLSTHRSCPATGVDVRLQTVITDDVKLAFGRAAEAAGFRWGGGSRRTNGIPFDWNHLDLGPRHG